MRFLKRTAAALALGLALAGGATVGAASFAPAALAQDMSTPEAKLAAILEMQGYPPGVLKWAHVTEEGADLVATGVYADVKTYNLGFDTIPLGDMRVSDVMIEGDYVTAFRARFTGIEVDLAELMAAGQKMGQSGGPFASAGTGVAMFAGYVQGLGYQQLALALDLATKTDLAAGTLKQDFGVEVADAFDLDLNIDATGVTPAYLDWAKTNALKLYLDRSPEALAEVQKQMEDANGPLATVGFARYALAFDDKGIMAKFEPQLAQARAMMLGQNADGTPKTEWSENDLKVAAGQMGGGVIPAEKLLPVTTAIYRFVMKPDVIRLAVNLDPALTMKEMQAMSNPAAGTGESVDWPARLSFEASN